MSASKLTTPTRPRDRTTLGRLPVGRAFGAARKTDRKNVPMLIQPEGGVQYVPLSVTKIPNSKDKQPG